MPSQSAENYLKAIFKATESSEESVGTNVLAAAMQTTAASVTDMVKRLAEQKLVTYEKYKGVMLTGEGRSIAVNLIRKHRLWEVFLVEKLGFAWDEVHDWAEELEHIQGDDLINRLDVFLGNPQYDPHGDPIPDANGQWTVRAQVLLSTLEIGGSGTITGVDDHSTVFLQYLASLGLNLGTGIQLIERFHYDDSVRIRTDAGKELVLSEKVIKNLFVKIAD